MFKRHLNAPLPRKQRYVRKLILCVKVGKKNQKDLNQPLSVQDKAMAQQEAESSIVMGQTRSLIFSLS